MVARRKCFQIQRTVDPVKVDSDTACIFQACLLSHVTVEEQPKLAMLRKSDEDWATFAKVS